MNIAGMHHARFAVPDLDRTAAFAGDFGLHVVERTADRLVMATGGGEAFNYVVVRAETPAFIGFGLTVASPADLDAAEALGATRRRTLDTPGGGKGVTLLDPDGFEIELVTGIVRGTAPKLPAPGLSLNSPFDRIRHGETQRQGDIGPARLFRLGHIGLFVRDFAASAEWYSATLGMIGSDVYHTPGDPAHRVVGFFRLDRGAEWVDHHTVALMQRDKPDCHHISFEAQDFEALFVAHRWLKDQGHESIWGVGRHPHGSHIFDVWRDPYGWRFETFSDTDLLQSDRAQRLHDIGTVQMDLWSSDPPDRYFA